MKIQPKQRSNHRSTTTFSQSILTMVSQAEKTPLLANAGESNNYYFLNNENGQGDEGGAFVEELPEGSRADEFEPKKLTAKEKV